MKCAVPWEVMLFFFSGEQGRCSSSLRVRWGRDSKKITPLKAEGRL